MSYSTVHHCTALFISTSCYIWPKSRTRVHTFTHLPSTCTPGSLLTTIVFPLGTIPWHRSLFKCVQVCSVVSCLDLYKTTSIIELDHNRITSGSGNWQLFSQVQTTATGSELCTIHHSEQENRSLIKVQWNIQTVIMSLLEPQWIKESHLKSVLYMVDVMLHRIN